MNCWGVIGPSLNQRLLYKYNFRLKRSRRFVSSNKNCKIKVAIYEFLVLANILWILDGKVRVFKQTLRVNCFNLKDGNMLNDSFDLKALRCLSELVRFFGK